MFCVFTSGSFILKESTGGMTKRKKEDKEEKKEESVFAGARQQV